MSAADFERVSLIGLGLMGGSLARALRGAPDPPEVAGCSLDPADLSAAREAGAIDRAFEDAGAAAAWADLVVYAAPLGATLRLLEAHRSVWREDAVVTDLASLKAPLVARATELGAADRYVGSHPMCGGEGSGFDASRSELYRGATVWLSEDGAGAPVCASMERFWRRLGARPEWIDAAEHDRRMVWASHVPQLASNALAATLEEAGIARSDLGPGGRDMTRLAGSSPAMWLDLFEASGADAAAAIGHLSATLDAWAKLLEHGALDELGERMERSRAWKRQDP